MKNYLTQNAKMAKMSGVKTFNWGIPAYKSAGGFKTCPWAGECAKGCYARQGAYVWSNVSQAFEARLALARSRDFVNTIDAEIKRRKIKRLRIHDSGDFFSPKYRDDWFLIMKANEGTEFYAYTKAIPLFTGIDLPSNFKLVYSEGGKLDHLIKATDRHSRVFPDLNTLKAAGYADTSKDDSVALGDNHRIGLIYHGSKGKAWSTGNTPHA